MGRNLPAMMKHNLFLQNDRYKRMRFVIMGGSTSFIFSSHYLAMIRVWRVLNTQLTLKILTCFNRAGFFNGRRWKLTSDEALR